ncbi:MAG: DUF2249 domain-containing protein [Rhizobacter sp.]|nr:DUF2249 domain-containing protein [Rhizobacter sp.]
MNRSQIERGSGEGCAPLEGAAANTLPPDAPGRRWREPDGMHIDVRGLAPPAPLVAILRLVHLQSDGTPVIVHHDRDPQLLYPELAQIGWQAERIAGAPGEVRLRLSPAPLPAPPPTP